MGSTKIILRQDVPGLGEEGDIKIVKRGYALNYLFPKGFAVDYSLKNKNILEKQKDVIEKKKLAKKENATALKAKLETEKVSIEVPAGEKGRLYGTVTTMQIEEKIKALGYDSIDKKNIVIKDHIKSGGKYKFEIHLYNEIYANMEIEVIPVAQQEEKKPKRQMRRKRRFDDDQAELDQEAPAAEAQEAAAEEPASEE